MLSRRLFLTGLALTSTLTPTRAQTFPGALALRLVRPAGRSLAAVEVAVGAQVSLVPVQDVQALMNALRVLVGDAQRSGCAS